MVLQQNIHKMNLSSFHYPCLYLLEMIILYILILTVWHHFSVQQVAHTMIDGRCGFPQSAVTFFHLGCNWVALLPTVYCSVWVASKLSNAWPPSAIFAVSTEEKLCGLLMVFSPVLFYDCCCFDCHVVSVCRCSSRRFFCTFLRRPQAPMTTSGWSYKPSLEYVQVCVTVFISLKEIFPLTLILCG